MRTALVTGASSGIGRELARVFARSGWNLVLVARSEAQLEELARELRQAHGVTALVVVADLSRDGAAATVFSTVTDRAVQVDALVNNAGIATHGLFADIPAEDELEAIHLNVIALTHLVKLFLPAMLARKNGYILNVAATAGFQPGPLMAVYFATKAYVLSLTEALANELSGSGISVTALCPGPTETGFQAKASLPVTRLFRDGAMSPALVAQAGYDALMSRRTIMIPGFWNRIMTFSVRISPRWLVAQIVRRLNEVA